jgi:hypothetical protein
MDSQFNSLIQSYNSNYVQYKVTGNQSYQNGYTAAKEGLDNIIKSVQEEVDSGKSKLSAFYKSGVEQKLSELNMKNRKLQRGIIVERDDIEAAKIRNEKPAPAPVPPLVSTSQYISMGVLGVALIVLSLL